MPSTVKVSNTFWISIARTGRKTSGDDAPEAAGAWGVLSQIATEGIW